MAQREVLLKRADSAKIGPDAGGVRQPASRLRAGGRDDAGRRCGIDPKSLADSAKTPAERERLAAARVEAYLDKVMAGEAQPVPVPSPLQIVLMNKYDSKVNAAGIDRAVERAQKIRTVADSTRAANQPKSAVPLPGGAAPGAGAPGAQAPAPEPSQTPAHPAPAQPAPAQAVTRAVRLDADPLTSGPDLHGRAAGISRICDSDFAVSALSPSRRCRARGAAADSPRRHAGAAARGRSRRHRAAPARSRSTASSPSSATSIITQSNLRERLDRQAQCGRAGARRQRGDSRVRRSRRSTRSSTRS